ncbi:MAG: META domain-containing protein [Bacteroidales bacterium]|nr:META domain-containing protein [Bacteroidales bacterium]
MKNEKNSRLLVGVLSLGIIVVLLVSCMTAKKKAELANNKPLVDTYWLLVSVKGEPVPQDFIQPTMTFGSDGRYFGNLGCNSFFGTYFKKGKNGIKMEYAGATKRLCQNMKTEKMYLNGLHNDFKTYEIHKDTLILKDKQGEVMRFLAGTKPEVQKEEE